MTDITSKDSEQDVKIAVLDSTLENATRRMELIHKRIDRTDERITKLNEEVIGADKVSEDYSKVMTADFVMSISRKVEDKVANLARVHIIKNRFGVDGVTYPTDMNTDIGKIMVNDSNTKQGQIASEKMNNSEEYLRKMAKNRFDNLG